MLRTLGIVLKWAFLLPLLLAVVLLAVANDQSVSVHLNPFDKADPVLTFELPLYQLGFLLFVLGVLFGGVIAWSSRRRRRRSRDRREATALWQARADWSESRQAEPKGSQASAYLPRPERG